MSTTVLDDAWELTPADRLVVEAERWGSRLRFAVLLLFYRARGRFPRAAEVDRHAAAALARALGVPAPVGAAALLPDSDDRTLKRQRAEIRTLLGFREATVADAEALGTWLRDHAAARTRDLGGPPPGAEGRRRGPVAERCGSSRPRPTGSTASSARRCAPTTSGAMRPFTPGSRPRRAPASTPCCGRPAPRELPRRGRSADNGGGGSQASIDRSSSIPRSSAKRAKSAIEA